MLTRSRRASECALALHEIDFLLGVRRPMAEIERLRASGVEYNALLRFRGLPVETFRSLWAEHGAFLRAECRRRGLAVPNPDEYVEGQHASWVRP